VPSEVGGQGLLSGPMDDFNAAPMEEEKEDLVSSSSDETPPDKADGKTAEAGTDEASPKTDITTSKKEE